MKKIGTLFLAVALVFVIGLTVSPNALQSAAAEDQSYDVAVADNENLAMNKYDWDLDCVGSAETEFSENGMLLKNFNAGGSGYALYHTNKLDEFKYSMYANLNLTWPSSKGYDSYNFNYSNLYISFLIDTDTPTPANTCPWNGNKAYVSLCFEERYDDATQTENDIVSLYLNECWNRRGDTRYSVATVRDVDFNDGAYHWYELEVKNFSEMVTAANGKEITKTGKLINFMFDGETKISYQLLDGNRTTTSADGEKMYVNFTALDGYLGFWPSSDFPVGADIDKTDCFVQIGKLKIVNLADDTAYTQCSAPEFEIELRDWAPGAKYETGEEIEVKLANLFSYEGEDALTYSVTCNGAPIGTVRNGFWVWTPDEAGTYDLDIVATAGGKSTTAYVTIRTYTSNVTPGNTDTPVQGGKCSGSLGAGQIVLLLAAAFGIVWKSVRNA